ncbi:MAG: hypothetical protein M1821_008048 [Bathelium mastoideum]|nr:MAG: hypothetical protein M1821_008048 [Bathelium mastoideum]
MPAAIYPDYKYSDYGGPPDITHRPTQASSAAGEPPPANHDIKYPDPFAGPELDDTIDEESCSSPSLQVVFLADSDAEDGDRVPTVEDAKKQLLDEVYEPNRADHQQGQPREDVEDRTQIHPIHGDETTRNTGVFSDSAHVPALNVNSEEPHEQRQTLGQDASSESAAEPLGSLQDGQTLVNDFVKNKESGGTSLRQNETVVDDSDSMTNYSDDGSTSTMLQDIYTSQIVDNLIAELKLGRHDVRNFDRLSSVMPQMLKAFACRIGYEAEKRELLDVMIFFNKYAAYVRSPKQKNIQPRKDADIALLFFREITQYFNEQVSLSHPNVEDKRNPVLGEEIPMSFLDKFENWNVSEAVDGLERGESSDSKSEELVEPKVENDYSEFNEPVEPQEQDTQLYQKLTVGTPAHQWLIANLRKELSLKAAYPDVKQQVADAIREKVRAIPKFRHLSRHRVPEPCHATFVIYWDLLGFLQEQEYEYQLGDSLQAAVVLIGDATNGQACTCAQYVRQTWPITGQCTIKLLSDLVTDPASSKQCKF